MLPPEPEWHKKWPTTDSEWWQRTPLFEAGIKHVTDERLMEILVGVMQSADDSWKHFAVPIVARELNKRGLEWIAGY